MAPLKSEDIYNLLPSPDLEKSHTCPTEVIELPFPHAFTDNLSLLHHTQKSWGYPPFAWALTTVEHPWSSGERMRRHFSFLSATDQSCSPQANFWAQPHQWVPTFINKRNKNEKSLPAHPTTSLENPHLEMCGVKWSQGEKQPSQKISFTGTMSLLREREV